jgi:type I restriction enzyme S subunit
MFYKETNFTETPVGEIPRDWEVVRLEKIFNLKNGQRPKLLEIGKIPVYGANGIMGYTNEFLVDNDFTIVIGRVGASGEIHLGRGKIWISDNAIYSESYEKSAVYPPFAYYLLKFKELSHFASKTTHPIITQSFLNHYPIQLPPPREQQKIAEILSTLDEAIQKTNEIIAKTERLKKGLMQELLTKGIGHKEFKDTEIGRIPKEWEVVSLEDVSLRIRTGPFGSQLKKSELSENGIKVYTQENILKNDFSLGNLYISNEKFEKLKTMEVKPGDVLLTIRGSTGYSAIFPEGAERGIIHTNLAYIRVKRSLLLPKYLSLLINDHPSIKSQLITLSSATTLGALYVKNIKKIKIPLPPIHEQQKIAEILSTVNKKLDIEKSEKAKLEKIKQGLMDLLLTGKIRVKVD